LSLPNETISVSLVCKDVVDSGALATKLKSLTFYLPTSIARQRYTRALLRRPQHVLVDWFVEVVVQARQAGPRCHPGLTSCRKSSMRALPFNSPGLNNNQLYADREIQKTYQDRVADMSGYQIQQFRCLLLRLDFISGIRQYCHKGSISRR